MSDMHDAFGLRAPYGKVNTQFDTEFDPSSGTLWGFVNPKGSACFSLGLLKDIRNHEAISHTYLQ